MRLLKLTASVLDAAPNDPRIVAGPATDGEWSIESLHLGAHRDSRRSADLEVDVFCRRPRRARSGNVAACALGAGRVRSGAPVRETSPRSVALGDIITTLRAGRCASRRWNEDQTQVAVEVFGIDHTSGVAEVPSVGTDVDA